MKNKKLNRDSQSRIALFKGQISSLIEHEEIITTSGKATLLKSMFEKMLTKARSGSIHARRQIQSVIGDGALVKKMVDELAPMYKDVKGGYTKMTMVGARKGDGAVMVKVSLTKKTATVASHKAGKSTSTHKASTSPKSAPTPQVVAPKVAKPTKVTNIAANKSGLVRKTGER